MMAGLTPSTSKVNCVFLVHDSNFHQIGEKIQKLIWCAYVLRSQFVAGQYVHVQRPQWNLKTGSSTRHSSK